LSEQVFRADAQRKLQDLQFVRMTWWFVFRIFFGDNVWVFSQWLDTLNVLLHTLSEIENKTLDSIHTGLNQHMILFIKATAVG